MKATPLILALALPAWAMAVQPESDKPTPHTVYVATTTGDTDPVVMTGEDGTADGLTEVVVYTTDEDAAADEGTHVAIMARVSGDDQADPNRGWLGIALGDASDVDGVVVHNVVRDSPAEAAGLKQNDIILSINGQTVHDYKAAVDAIRAIGPGGVAAITVNRGGQTLTLNATLSSRPKTLSWVKEPDGLNLRDISKGKMFLVTPQGQQQLGDTAFNVNKSVTVDNGHKTVEIVVDKEDDHFEITQVDDGPITVTRNGVVNEYADADALAAADPDAAEVFNQSQNGHMLFMPDGNGIQLFFGDKDMDFSKMAPGDLNEMIQQQLKSAMNGGDFGGAKAFGFALNNAAHRSFRVTPDGQIEVTVRRGSDELVTVYQDAADLEARNPDLYEKYADLLNANPVDQK